MSARIVCSGTRPSEYISRRLISPPEAAGGGDLDPLSAGPHRRRERALHRATEADPVLELLGDRLRDELRVELGPLDLVDVDVDVLLRDRVQLTAERVHLDAGLADHDPRARREDVHRDPLLVLADEDVGQARVRQLPEDVLADANVLEEVLRELGLARPPVRLPVVDDADAEAAGMHLLAHQATASFLRRRVLRPGFGRPRPSASSAAGASACLRGAPPRHLPAPALGEDECHVARPLADPVDATARTGPPALERRPLVRVGGLDDELVAVEAAFASAFATAERSTFSISIAAARGVNARIVRASGTVRPRMWSSTIRALRADMRTHFACA